MISEFRKVLIKLLSVEGTPTHVVTVNEAGLLGKASVEILGGNIDGGFANSIYLSSQYYDGGNANN